MARRSDPHQSPAKEPAATPLRFAHPFYTSTPPDRRAVQPGVGRRMTDWISKNLGPIPAPGRNSNLALAEIISEAGVAEIEALGAIRFHSVGDTNRTTGGTEQEDVAADMALDLHPDGGGANPAFFLHLGDVLYGQHKDNFYRDELHRPYKESPVPDDLDRYGAGWTAQAAP